MSQQKPSYNLLFTKASSLLTSATADIICLAHVTLLDYEIELGLIITTPITFLQQITEESLQQWFKGKSYHSFCPVGPYIYLLDPDEISVLNHLHLELKINDEVRQTVLTDQLLYKPAETLSEMSEIFDLRTRRFSTYGYTR